MKVEDQPKVSKFKPAPNVGQGHMFSKFLTATCPQIPKEGKRRAIARNAPCPCGKLNELSLEWRMVDGDLKQVPRPMKFKNCCHASNRAAKRYKATPARQIISQRMQATLDAMSRN